MNADNALIQNSELLGNNLYAYCMNNPINLKDPNGNFAISTIVKAIKNTTKKVVQAISKVAAKFSIPDYSKELNETLISNAYEIISNREIFGGEVTAMDFYNSVNHGGTWDYKIPEQWKNSIGVSYTETFIFNGNIMTPEDFGNINYGFTGMVAGFSSTMLFIGGGYAKTNKISIRIFIGPNYGDDVNDHAMIQYGIELYHKYFK